MELTVSAYFQGAAGSPLDKGARSIMAEKGGKFIGSGTFLGTGERDIQYGFSDRRSARVAVDALKKAGYRTGA